MNKVYICSPCRGDYANNIQRAREYSRAAVLRGYIPVTPHVYLTQFMDDTIPEERDLALRIGLELVPLCSELWAFGLEKPTEGMAGEIALAKKLGIPVVNGFRAITELNPEISAASVIMCAAEELAREESRRRVEPMKRPAKVGNVTISLPPRRALMAGMPDFDGITLELDGSVILELAEQLRANPGESFEVSGGGTA